MFGKLFGRKSHDPIQQYAKRSHQMDRRFHLAPQPSGDFQSVGTVKRVTPYENGCRVDTEHGAISIQFILPQVVKVRIRHDGQFQPHFSYALDEAFTPAPPAVSLQETSQSFILTAPNMTCLIGREDGTLQFSLGERVVSADIPKGSAWLGSQVRWKRQLHPQERCYGLGERAFGLNLRGNKLSLWNTDAVHYQRGSDPLYYSIPFYFGLHPQYTVGILWDNPSRSSVDLGAAEQNAMTFEAEGGELRFYLIADESPHEVMKTYFLMTGAPPLLPLWAFGYHQSRYSYMPSDRFRELAAEFRQRQIPCDVLHFDIEYMDQYQVFTWDPKAFADLPQLLREMNQQGFKGVAILDPAIKTEPTAPVFQSGQQHDAFLKYPDGTLFTAPVWAGTSAFPDFSDPKARAWWAEQVAQFMQVGFAGVWNDMNEPTIFAPKTIVSTLPDYLPLSWEGEGNIHRDGGHNTYGMLMARASREGVLKANPDKRPFILTRAAYAGAQRYTGTWTGDNTASWDHLRLTVSMMLNAGLSGMLFNGPDIGGFHGTPDGELYARWIQMASMFPFFRTHTVKGTPDQEPWSYGKDIEEIAKYYITLRYQLLPYLYSIYTQAASDGLPPIRPTFMYDRSDPRLFEQDDAFMVGDVLLVAPILEAGVTSREVYLPKGVWYDFWTRKTLEGSRTIEVQAPLNLMPIFTKSGKVLPMYPPMQYVDEMPVEELLLRGFAGLGETTVYEDAGEGFGYLEGEYRWSYFSNRYLPNGEFAIDWRTAGKYVPAYKKVRFEIIGISAEPESVLIDEQPAALWFYERGTVEVLTNPFQSLRIIGKVQDEEASAETIVSRSHPELKDLFGGETGS